MITPAAPIIEPIDRSNSPIISIAAATAMMPSWAETSRKLMMPGAENRLPLPATAAKKRNTRMVPATAPSSGARHQPLEQRRRGDPFVDGGSDRGHVTLPTGGSWGSARGRTPVSFDYRMPLAARSITCAAFS